jgi:glycosyltransferase involved in cell wall biosynthesis
MWLGRPLIASRCIGTEDYINSGVDGLLVHPRDPHELRQAIAKLWDDSEARVRMGRAAHERAVAQYSDEMAGAALARILNRFSA